MYLTIRLLGSGGHGGNEREGERGGGRAYLGVTTLVDQLADGLEVGVAVGNVGLHPTEQVDGAAVELDED